MSRGIRACWTFEPIWYQTTDDGSFSLSNVRRTTLSLSNGFSFPITVQKLGCFYHISTILQIRLTGSRSHFRQRDSVALRNSWLMRERHEGPITDRTHHQLTRRRHQMPLSPKPLIKYHWQLIQ